MHSKTSFCIMHWDTWIGQSSKTWSFLSTLVLIPSELAQKESILKDFQFLLYIFCQKKIFSLPDAFSLRASMRTLSSYIIHLAIDFQFWALNRKSNCVIFWENMDSEKEWLAYNNKVGFEKWYFKINALYYLN